ncbi:endonuclease/exonuclease/phosphatase family protein [Lentimicrobium sp. S6]|uniref:endonuclease/exonuclease/phosphatase family protein n=1 Tax=Lentimicrobium sp. S6 TaxID=2735872 RepID=UPI0020A68784|nr:endonuclease/exonuclease/phosphatase family protein [Lentimicrobium sp. S6]
MKHIISKLLTIFMVFSISLTSFESKAQQYEIVAIGYYNLENLFDTIDSEGVAEGDFLPNGAKKWNAERYYYKLDQMARVLSEIATDKTPDGLAIFGISEIENRFVVEDLVKTDALKDRNYQVVHYNSPDRRGIDVALVYNPDYFELTNSYSAPFMMADTNFKSRDQLVVTGLLKGEEVHFQVNHWPSRGGGEKRSRPKRVAAADLSRSLADSLLALNPNAKVMIMGDLNDDPVDISVAKHLKATDDKSKLSEGYFYNPFMTKYKKGIGSLAYRDSWNLFDQIIMTPALVAEDRSTWTYFKSEIFKKPYMINQEGKYKGYPKRSFVGNKFQGGYSDHFPVYMYLVREVK